MPTATLKIFLAYGDPKRLRTAELSNWTGKAVSGPRSEFEKVLEREESNGSGVNAIKLSPNPLNQNKISASSTRLVSCEEQILMQITDVAHEASIGAARLDVLGTSFQ